MGGERTAPKPMVPTVLGVEPLWLGGVSAPHLHRRVKVQMVWGWLLGGERTSLKFRGKKQNENFSLCFTKDAADLRPAGSNGAKRH